MAGIEIAVVPIAGRATRSLPASKVIPKCLFPVGNIPVIHYAVEEAMLSGVTHFVFIVNDESELVKRYFERDADLARYLEAEGKPQLLDSLDRIVERTRIEYVQQRPLEKSGKGCYGLGASVLCAREYISAQRFAIVLPNDLILSVRPCLKQLIDASSSNGASVIACRSLPWDRLSTYGNMKVVAGKVTEMIQRPERGKELSSVAVIGRYVVTRDIFDIIASLSPGYGAELQLTDAPRRVAPACSWCSAA